MTKHLDPRFAKIVALMNSTVHPGERQTARKRADAVAASCGMTFDEALAYKVAPASKPFSFMDSFDDHMERKETGWKARQAADQSEKERQRLERRAGLLERYGSEEAALAPCMREQMLRVALAAWRRPCERPWQRWTRTVDGCSGFRRPAHIDDAVRSAYPMPTTLTEALAEYEYWRVRRDEMEDVLGPNGCGDCGLDRPAEFRMDLVRDLVESGLPAQTLTELHARFSFYRGMEVADQKIEDALFRDLKALVAKADLSTCPRTPTPIRPRQVDS